MGNRTDIFPKRKRVSQSYKLDRDHLIRLIEANPDMMLKELSSELNVSIHMDETGFAPRTSRTHGYGIVGKRIYGNVDSAKRPRISLIRGYLNNKLIALILPPYSPHLNSIEKLWANIKQAWKYEISGELDRILISSDFIWN